MGDRSDRSEDRGARVYVGGLAESVKKEDLEGEFEKYGKLNSVWVAFNPPGFAFIEFNNLIDAETACDNLNGTDFRGSKLRVELARGRRRGGFRGGRGGPRGRGGPPGGGFRGGPRRGGPGGGRFGDRGDRGGRFGGRDFGRRSDGYGGGRGGRGGPPRRFDSGGRYRSRSPNAGPRR